MIIEEHTAKRTRMGCHGTVLIHFEPRQGSEHGNEGCVSKPTQIRCAKHLEANVALIFGKQCTRYVCPIATSFFTWNSGIVFDESWKVKPDAATYLEEMTESDVLWRSSQWISCLSDAIGRDGTEL